MSGGDFAGLVQDRKGGVISTARIISRMLPFEGGYYISNGSYFGAIVGDGETRTERLVRIHSRTVSVLSLDTSTGDDLPILRTR